MPLEVKSEERRVKNSIDSFKGKKADAVENSLRPSGYGLVFEFFLPLYLFTFFSLTRQIFINQGIRPKG